MSNKIFIALILLFFQLPAAISQNRGSGAFTFTPDFIITQDDTIHCQIDPESLDDAKIKYTLPSDPDKTLTIKVGDVIKLKSRFVYKNVEVEGQTELLKVLTEDHLSLYSKEKKGKTRITDQEPQNLYSPEPPPSRSTFYLEYDDTVNQITKSNFKTMLKQAFMGDEALLARIDDLKFEELEFTLLNMVIRYNYRQDHPQEQN